MDQPLTGHILNPDTQAVLLLCGRFGRPRDGDAQPLQQSEYNRLAVWLRDNGMRPSDLLSPEGLARAETVVGALPVEFARLRLLMQRGGPLALAVESWSNMGLWVISRSDRLYPERFRTGRLGPPILYGVGRKELLSAGGLAIVGSRDISPDDVEYTRSVARACAGQGLQVVSGGARGVDTEAMLAALHAGGTSVGVLAAGMAKAAVMGSYRQGLMDGRLALCSPYDPGAGFNIGNAMARNKLIYGLADQALIVRSGYQTGGTWAGAIEALKGGKTPVFVRHAGSVPPGNRELLDKSALPFPPEPWPNLAAQLSALTGL
jgi:predicted Rossmann fold nucleotide-binding protein DprA/Smf involved in DNA uptake